MPVYKARAFKKWDTQMLHPKLGWIPARPMSIDSPLRRLIIAWCVLIGKYDALDWEDQ